MSRQVHIPVILTSRDLLILRTLVTTRILGTTEIMTVAGFASLRRANRRLLKLVRAGFLRRWFVPTESGGQRALYGFPFRGARQIDEAPLGLINRKLNALITSSQFIAPSGRPSTHLHRRRTSSPFPRGSRVLDG